jgi:hypothetical protein
MRRSSSDNTKSRENPSAATLKNSLVSLVQMRRLLVRFRERTPCLGSSLSNFEPSSDRSAAFSPWRLLTSLSLLNGRKIVVKPGA